MKRLITILLSVNLLCCFKINANPNEERIYILSEVWRNVKENFAFPEHFQNVNPDSLYRVYIPKVLNTKTDKEFTLLLQEFLAKFGDAHTRLIYNEPASVPIKFIGINDTIVVSNVTQDYNRLIPIGSQLMKVNNIPVLEYLKNNTFPFVSASNNEWLFRKSLDSFLDGEPDSEVSLEFETPSSGIIEFSVPLIIKDSLNSTNWSKSDPEVISIKELGNDIAYMKLSTCTQPQISNKVFERNINLLRNSKGIIIDIRENRGGTDETWNPNIIKHIAPNGVDILSAVIMKCRVSNNSFNEYGKQVHNLRDYAENKAMQPVNVGKNVIDYPDSLKFNSPVILLIDGYTGSAAEDFAYTIKNLNLGTIVGSHTIGCVSHPRTYLLPSGHKYLMSTWAFTNPDGSSLIENGITPDFEVPLYVSDYINGRDPQLEKAIQLLINL